MSDEAERQARREDAARRYDLAADEMDAAVKHLRITARHFRDGEVRLRAGELFVIPRGVEHKPYATEECRMMLVEPAGTINTGGVKSELTAKDGVWV